MKTIDPTRFTLSPVTTLCPNIEIDIVFADGMSLSDEIITYDADTYEFRLDTQDTEEVGVFDLKIIASFSGDTYMQTSEYPFTVTLIDYCVAPTVTNPGSSHVAKNYYYSGSAIFNLARFSVSSEECIVTYSCDMSQGPAQDLCDYSDELTTSTFDPETGNLSFTTSDI